MQDEGAFLTLEGIDFTGKSTIVRKLGTELSALGLNPVLTSDPPARSPWTKLKKEVLDKQTRISGPAEALLYLAGRVDNVIRVIGPALAKGRVVISDRFNDSWIAYWAPVLKDQLGSIKAAIDWLSGIDSLLKSQGLMIRPRRTYLLLDDPEAATLRAPKKPRTKWEDARILIEVQDVYLELARRDVERYRIYDIRNSGLRAATADVVQDATHYIRDRVGF